jgi:EAL domain-containing protein (putative c-di-GMP-specific phosphodiesterase class I)
VDILQGYHFGRPIPAEEFELQIIPAATGALNH